MPLNITLTIPDMCLESLEQWLDGPENTRQELQGNTVATVRIAPDIQTAFHNAIRSRLADICARFPSQSVSDKLALIQQLQNEVKEETTPGSLLTEV